MSTEPTEDAEPTEPPPADVRDTPTDPALSTGADEDSDKDAMGIDDDDPIDKTLVGSPVEDDRDD